MAEVEDFEETGAQAGEGSVPELDAEGLIEPKSDVSAAANAIHGGDEVRAADPGQQMQQADPARAETAALGLVAEALQAAAGQVTREREAAGEGAAALAQALKTFLETFSGQNVPSRSEFRDLAARLDRLSSQFQKGR